MQVFGSKNVPWVVKYIFKIQSPTAYLRYCPSLDDADVRFQRKVNIFGIDIRLKTNKQPYFIIYSR